MPVDNKIDQADTAQDDWLNETAQETGNAMFSEGDQANIDALLSADNLTASPGSVKSAVKPPESIDEEMIGDLNQDDIDALLGTGNRKPPESAVAAATGSLASPTAEEMISPLHQDDIDALFGGSAPPDVAAGSSTLSGAADEEMIGDLNQDDIDALLGGGKPSINVAAPTSPASPTAVDSSGPLHQDDIDALFGGGEKASAPQAAAQVDDANEGIHVIDQAHLDALLNSDRNSEISIGINALIQDSSAAPPVTGVPSQEEMDKIFFEAMASEKEREKTKSDDDLFLDEMMGEAAVSSASGMKAFGLDENDFKFDDDTPDIPGEKAVEEPRIEVKKRRADVSASPADDSVEVKVKSTVFQHTLPIWLHNIRTSRSIRMGALFSLLLFLGAGLYYGLWPKIEPLLKAAFKEKAPIQAPVIAVKPAQPTVQTVKVQPAKEPTTLPNRAPQVKGGVYQIAENSLGVFVRMTGHDEDGDALTYQVTGKPRFGVLYGESPNITYVASIGFPGQDMFEFQANDGHVASGSAIIRIIGPDLTKIAGRPQHETRQVGRTSPRTSPYFQAATSPSLPQEILTEEAPQSAPAIQTAALRPGDIEHIYMLNTEPVIIDWAELWRFATSKSFDANVHVDIEGADIHGQLEKLGAARSRYTSEPFFVGEESIRYRFTVGKKRSKIRQLYISIANGNPYPQIHLKPLEKEIYAVGETIELDASASRDDNRATLSFAWEQTAGPLIKFQKVNGEGSVVRFMAPAVFSNQQNPGLTLRLLAKDSSGQISTREVLIAVQSRRSSPLWGQVLAANNLNQPQACPEGDCSALRLFR